jgi:predicted RNA binding protein YcfA (HicA-like mRNA interferase family)
MGLFQRTGTALAGVGFAVGRQKGSLIMLCRANPPATISVPNHRELDRGTLRAILLQADWSVEAVTGLL